jgi:hypothetical protein
VVTSETRVAAVGLILEYYQPTFHWLVHTKSDSINEVLLRKPAELRRSFFKKHRSNGTLRGADGQAVLQPLHGRAARSSRCRGFIVPVTNPIESAFATIRHRSDRAKGCVTRVTMLAMMFQLALAAEQGFRKLRGFAHLAKIIAGVRLVDGVERIEDQEVSRAAA